MADEPTAPGGSEFLDQSEIDKLLAQTGDQAASPAVVVTADGRRLSAAAERPKVESYDFRHPAFLSEIELRRLRLLHEEFIRYLSARLSLFLRMEFGLKMAGLSTITYAKFTEALPNPTHLCLFKTEPLTGVGIMGIGPHLALTIADRLLGGRGNSVKTERPLTEIEVGLLEDVILVILEEWSHQWGADTELHPRILGHESNARFLQTSPKDAIVLFLTLEVNFGDCAEQLQVGVPYYTIEPLVKKLQTQRPKDASAPAAEKQRVSWSQAYDDIGVPVRAEWEGFETSLRDIASLRVGDVLELPDSLLQQTRLLLNDAPKFVGAIGLDTDRVAVQITRKITSS